MTHTQWNHSIRGKTVDIPLGKVDDRGNLVIDNITAVSINGKPAANIKRSTSRNEDAVSLCETYFQKLEELVMECHDKFKLQ